MSCQHWAPAIKLPRLTKVQAGFRVLRSAQEDLWETQLICSALVLLCRSCVGEIKAQMAEHTLARQRLPLSTPAGTRRAKLAPGVVLQWPLHLQTRPVWVLGIHGKATYQLPRDAPCPVTFVLEAWAALSLCHSSLSLRKQRGHCLLLNRTEEWEERKWMAFLKHGKRNVLSWLPWKLGMDNKHLDVLSCPLALVACNLCEKNHYLVQGGWQVSEWGKKKVKESVPGHPSRMHPSRGATETAGKWHFLRCCQRMGTRYPGKMGSEESNI